MVHWQLSVLFALRSSLVVWVLSLMQIKSDKFGLSETKINPATRIKSYKNPISELVNYFNLNKKSVGSVPDDSRDVVFFHLVPFFFHFELSRQIVTHSWFKQFGGFFCFQCLLPSFFAHLCYRLWLFECHTQFGVSVGRLSEIPFDWRNWSLSSQNAWKKRERKISAMRTKSRKLGHPFVAVKFIVARL